jgi:hypothetical protein
MPVPDAVVVIPLAHLNTESLGLARFSGDSDNVVTPDQLRRGTHDFSTQVTGRSGDGDLHFCTPRS